MYLCLYLYHYLYLTLPNLQVSYIPTYLLYAGTTSAGNNSFVHLLTPSLPVAGLVYMSVCVPVRLCVRVSPCICPCACTYIQYPQKIHIKDTCTRVSWGMWLFLILKTYLPIRSTQKTTRRTSVHPPCLSQLHSVNLCASQSKISLSNWRPKTTVCLAR